nr:hypothetical protein [Sicyoidochytrium minutum DNA virus]
MEENVYGIVCLVFLLIAAVMAGLWSIGFKKDHARKFVSASIGSLLISVVFFVVYMTQRGDAPNNALTPTPVVPQSKPKEEERVPYGFDEFFDDEPKDPVNEWFKESDIDIRTRGGSKPTQGARRSMDNASVGSSNTLPPNGFYMHSNGRDMVPVPEKARTEPPLDSMQYQQESLARAGMMPERRQPNFGKNRAASLWEGEFRGEDPSETRFGIASQPERFSRGERASVTERRGYEGSDMAPLPDQRGITGVDPLYEKVSTQSTSEPVDADVVAVAERAMVAAGIRSVDVSKTISDDDARAGFDAEAAARTMMENKKKLRELVFKDQPEPPKPIVERGKRMEQELKENDE